MDDQAREPARCLPYVLAATATVTLAPAAAVWGIGLSGVVTDFLPLMAIGLLVSLLVAFGGRVLWEMRPESRDLLFSDLMLWGWLRRWRLERRLGDARTLLGLDPRAVLERSEELDPETRIKALQKLVVGLEARDRYAHGHSRRVARYSIMIAKRLGIPAAEVTRIRLAATLHDVGKLVVPPAVLNKRGRPTEVEFGVIKRHALVGADMVSPIGDDELTQIVAHHHERLDGTGYPSQLSGSEIPLGARIVAVADTFDSLTSTRVYKPAKRHRDVFRLLGEEMGTQLDPAAVQAFSRSYSGFRGIAAWSIVCGAPQRVLLPLAGQAPIAGGTLSAKTLAALTATAALGGVVSSSSPTDPRDAGAGPAAETATAAFGASAPGVPFPGVRSVGPPSRGHGQGGNASSGRPAGGGREGGSDSDQPSGGGPPLPDDQPGLGGEPGPFPGPGNPARPDVPAAPGNPGSPARQIVERHAERLEERIARLPEAVKAREPPGLDRPFGGLHGALGRPPGRDNGPPFLR